MGRNGYIAMGLALTACMISMPDSASATTRWQAACDANQTDLRLTERITGFDLDAAQSAAADAAAEAAGKLAQLSREQIDALRRAAHGLSKPQDFPAQIPAQAAKAAASGAAGSMASAFAGLAHADAIRALESIQQRLPAKLDPLPASADAAGFSDCTQARATVQTLEAQLRSMEAQLADLDYLRRDSICPALSADTYQRIATQVGRFDETVIRLGLALDAVSLSGTTNATELLTNNRKVAELAMSIHHRLESLRREADGMAPELDRRRANLDANLTNILRPAAAEVCKGGG